MTTSAVQAETWVPELDFSAKLALVRHRMGWNIKEAALACGLPPQSWRGWEIQRRLPHNIRAVGRSISNRTGVDYSWLMEEDVTERPDAFSQHYKPTPVRPPDNRPPNRPLTDRARPGSPKRAAGRTYRISAPLDDAA